MSTYIRRPSYWEGALAGERTMKDMRPLAVLGDNITTDHLSPSNAIQKSSAAGAIWIKWVCRKKITILCNAQWRSSDRTKSHFANPKLLNEMAFDENGEIIQGSLARLEPEGKQMRMWETIETYMERKTTIDYRCRQDYGIRFFPWLAAACAIGRWKS